MVGCWRVLLHTSATIIVASEELGFKCVRKRSTYRFWSYLLDKPRFGDTSMIIYAAVDAAMLSLTMVRLQGQYSMLRIAGITLLQGAWHHVTISSLDSAGFWGAYTTIWHVSIPELLLARERLKTKVLLQIIKSRITRNHPQFVTLTITGIIAAGTTARIPTLK